MVSPQFGAGTWVVPQSQTTGIQYTEPQAAPRFLARAQAQEEQPSAVPAEVQAVTLRIPCPEDLGIGAEQRGAASSVDWSAVHGRLNQLGATCFQEQKTAQGGYRIICLLPARQQGQLHHIEVDAASETEAVRRALAEAEEWTARMTKSN
jgi:hypothetical protein